MGSTVFQRRLQQAQCVSTPSHHPNHHNVQPSCAAPLQQEPPTSARIMDVNNIFLGEGSNRSSEYEALHLLRDIQDLGLAAISSVEPDDDTFATSSNG